MSKICPVCGVYAPDDSVFCPNCGKPIASQQTYSQTDMTNNPPYNMNSIPYDTSRGKKKIKAINIILIVIAVIQLIVICFVRPGWLRHDGENAGKAERSVMSVCAGGVRHYG